MILLLQQRRQSAAELARRLEVSLRTVHRDIEALSLAGVPVYAERGRSGGFALLDGWRGSFGGLTAPEIQALATAKAALALSELGLAGHFDSGLLKLTNALPEVQRAISAHTQARLYVDTSGWFSARESVDALPLLREAVWQDRTISFAYQDFDGERSERSAHPLGLVIKAERWYLVAKERRCEPAVFRCGRITHVKLGALYKRPARFQLARFWETWSARFREARPCYLVQLSINTRAAQSLLSMRPKTEHAQLTPQRKDCEPWLVSIDFEREPIAFSQLLELGADAEVLSPPALRVRLASLGRSLSKIYEGTPQKK